MYLSEKSIRLERNSQKRNGTIIEKANIYVRNEKGIEKNEQPLLSSQSRRPVERYTRINGVLILIKSL